MWWKIAIAAICALIVISPADLSPAILGFEDWGALIAMIASIASAIKGIKKDSSSKHSEGVYNDVDNN